MFLLPDIFFKMLNIACFNCLKFVVLILKSSILILLILYSLFLKVSNYGNFRQENCQNGIYSGQYIYIYAFAKKHKYVKM